jgi:hypothetical protein
MKDYNEPTTKLLQRKNSGFKGILNIRPIVCIVILLFSITASAQPVLINPAITCSSLDRLNVGGCFRAALEFDGNRLNADVAALYTSANPPVTASVINVIADPNNGYCSWSFTYTYKIQDATQNFTTCDVTYSGSDNILPTFTIPPDITIYQTATCNPENPLPSVSGDVTDAFDNCGVYQITYVDCGTRKGGPGTNSGGGSCTEICPGQKIIERRWFVRDSCGNEATGLQKIFLVDTIKPVFTVFPQSLLIFGCEGVNYNVEAVDGCSGPADLSYTFSGATTGSGSGSGSGSAFNYGITTVTVTARDCAGNTAQQSFDVKFTCDKNINLTINAAITRTIYRGAVSGFGPFGPQSIQLSSTITGGTAPYTYSWSPATGLNNSHIANPIANPSSTTTYTLIVTDHLGHTRNMSITINVLQLSSAVCSGSGNNTKFNVCYNQQNICVSGNQVPQKLANGGYLGPCSDNSVTTVIDIDVCAAITRTIYTGTVSGYGPFGPQSINLSSTATGGIPGYTYHWSPAAGLDNANIANPVASPASTTAYTLTVTDNNSSSRSLGITINVLPLSSAVCSGNGNNVKFNVCHIPPGNPDNGHNICISVNALPAHLVGGGNGHNNCHLGPCDQQLCYSTVPPGCQAPITGKSANQVIDASDEKETITEAKDELSVQVFPNPSSGEFNIQVFSKSNEPVTVRILDNNGVVKSVNSISSKSNFITVGSKLPTGIYVAEVIQGNNRQTVKLIKLN